MVPNMLREQVFPALYTMNIAISFQLSEIPGIIGKRMCGNPLLRSQNIEKAGDLLFRVLLHGLATAGEQRCKASGHQFTQLCDKVQAHAGLESVCVTAADSEQSFDAGVLQRY